MSYILEALKKSQQERELGHVPTLETPAFIAGEEKDARPSSWILLAVVMAVLAVIIASYSALRGGALDTESLARNAQTDPTAASGQLDQDPARSIRPTSEPLDPPPSPEPASVPSSNPRRTMGAPRTPGPADPEISTQAAVMQRPAAPSQSPVQKTPAAVQPQAARQQEPSSKVPPDLIADIESFKRQVREEQSDVPDTEKIGNEIAPRDLRLPKDVRKRLPEFVMSAHIYDEEPSKRFVLINGLKTLEGETSREEITVEQILPDGVVFGFEGHRFFRRRR